MFSDVLLTVDFDRTLTGPDSQIPQRNLDAIAWFTEHGGSFTVNTGRSVSSFGKHLETLPVNAPVLMYNGSARWQAGNLEDMKLLDLDLWETVHECQRLFPDLTVEVQALDKHYDFAPNPAWDAFSAHNCAYATAQWGQDLGPFLKFSLYGEIRDVTVADLFEGSAEERARMDEVEQLLNEKYGEHCEIFRACPRIIDIHAKGVSKANIARYMLSRLGKARLVCVGDGENDVPMLDDADFSL